MKSGSKDSNLEFLIKIKLLIFLEDNIKIIKLNKKNYNKSSYVSFYIEY